MKSTTNFLIGLLFFFKTFTFVHGKIVASETYTYPTYTQCQTLRTFMKHQFDALNQDLPQHSLFFVGSCVRERYEGESSTHQGNQSNNTKK
jgi:hypothetical protein